MQADTEESIAQLLEHAARPIRQGDLRSMHEGGIAWRIAEAGGFVREHMAKQGYKNITGFDLPTAFGFILPVNIRAAE